MRVTLWLMIGLLVWGAEVSAQNKKPKNPPKETPAEVSPVKILSEEGSKKFKEGKYPEAVVFFQQAYALENNPGFLWNIAVCLLKMDKINEARSYLEAVIVGASPDSVVYQKAKEKLDELTQSSEPAQTTKKETNLQSVEQLKKVDPAEIKKIADEGNLKFQEKKYIEAMELYKQAYKLDNQPGFLFNIGRCHSMLEEWAAAKDTYRLVLVLMKETEFMYQKATEYYKEAEEKLAAGPKRVLAEEPTTRPKPILPKEPKRPTTVRVLYGASTSSFVLTGALVVSGSALLGRASLASSDFNQVPVGKLSSPKSIARDTTLGTLCLAAAGGFLLVGTGARLAGWSIEKQTNHKISFLLQPNQITLNVGF